MCGVVAGPLFVAVATAQVLTRDGFDLGHQPISLLSVGDHGWIQISNFVVAGLLNIAFSIGVRRAAPPGRLTAWASTLLTVYGVGLVAGGAFVPDPALGFPPGTPDEIPDEMSWHATLHAVGPALAFLALISASLVLARWFGLQGRQWMGSLQRRHRCDLPGSVGLAGHRLGRCPAVPRDGHRLGVGDRAGRRHPAADPAHVTGGSMSGGSMTGCSIWTTTFSAADRRAASSTSITATASAAGTGGGSPVTRASRTPT